MRKLAFVFVLLVHTTIFAQGATPRIVGGVESAEGDYPWMVALLDTDTGDVFQAQSCGGTLIRPDVVLTAAHCVVDLADISEMDVAVGVYDLSRVTAAQRITLAAIIIHPDYDPVTIDNDIALLRLSRSAFTPTVTMVDPITMNTLDGYMPLTVMGWGADADPDITQAYYPYTLWQAEVDYIVPGVCNELLQGELTDNMICAAVVDERRDVVGGRDACFGDSGGPLIYNYNGSLFQVGIVSWGWGCAKPNEPGVYTRVANYGEWINQAPGSSGSSGGGGLAWIVILALVVRMWRKDG